MTTTQATSERTESTSDVDRKTGSVQNASAATGESPTSDRSGNSARRHLHRQSTAIVVLVVLAVLYSIHVARAILMPVLIALILTLLLRPLIRRCRKHHIPAAFSAAIAMLVLLLMMITTVANLIGPAREWIGNAPSHLQDVREKLHAVREQIDQINLASSKVRELADADRPDVDSGESYLEQTIRDWTASDGNKHRLNADEEQPVPVEVRQPGLTTGLSVLSITGGFLAGVVITIVLTYFLLATGDQLLNNVLHVMPTFRDKRNIVVMVHAVEQGVSSYLLTVTLINLVLGIVIATAMGLLGVPNPTLWGAMATVLNFIPYLGATTGTVVVFLVAVLSFDSLSYAFLVPTVYFGLTALEGNAITPSVLGRRMSMSPVFVFLSLIFWGWMWGVGGALIAVPTLAMLKVGFDQFDRTRPLGTLLGG